MPYLNLFLCIENVASGGIWVGREERGGGMQRPSKGSTQVFMIHELSDRLWMCIIRGPEAGGGCCVCADS